ncbi:hypothetical protein HDV05_001659, partial [Chytridiales sp. JEL 0842]
KNPKVYLASFKETSAEKFQEDKKPAVNAPYALFPEAKASCTSSPITSTILIAILSETKGQHSYLNQAWNFFKLQTVTSTKSPRTLLDHTPFDELKEFTWCLAFDMEMLKRPTDTTFAYFLITDGYQASWLMSKQVERPVTGPTALTPASVPLADNTIMHFIDKGRVTLFDVNTVRRTTHGVVLRCKKPPNTVNPSTPLRGTKEARVLKQSRHPSASLEALQALEDQSLRDGEVNAAVLRKLQFQQDRRKPKIPKPQKGLNKFEKILDAKGPDGDVEYNWRFTAKEWRNLTGQDSFAKLRNKVDVNEGVAVVHEAIGGGKKR